HFMLMMHNNHRYKYLFLGLLAALAVSYYNTLNNFKRALDPLAQTCAVPVQGAPGNSAPIKLSIGGSDYLLEPLHSYEATAMVMGTSRNLISSIRDIIPFDLGLCWGQTLCSGEFRKVEFSSMLNHFYAQWPSGVRVKLSDMANSHIVPGSPQVLAKLKKLVPGDQIRLKGVLVNVRKYPFGQAGRGRPERELMSSTTREDKGDGACEIIYVASPYDVQLLSPGERLYPEIYRHCLWLLPALLLVFVLHSHIPFMAQ
ncbi:MAG TPA: hypothetical protein PLL10_05960, partial [Elusimicrobiales bacterium]|nr:hypothetical protein [Elusimicrobiales bacterium]